MIGHLQNISNKSDIMTKLTPHCQVARYVKCHAVRVECAMLLVCHVVSLYTLSCVTGHTQLCHWTDSAVSLDICHWTHSAVSLDKHMCHWTHSAVSLDTLSCVTGHTQLCHWTHSAVSFDTPECIKVYVCRWCIL